MVPVITLSHVIRPLRGRELKHSVTYRTISPAAQESKSGIFVRTTILDRKGPLETLLAIESYTSIGLMDFYLRRLRGYHSPRWPSSVLRAPFAYGKPSPG